MMDSLLAEDHHKIISIHPKWDQREVYGKISTNAILTFNFFFDRNKSNSVSLVRLSPWKKINNFFLEGFHLCGMKRWKKGWGSKVVKCGAALPSAACKSSVQLKCVRAHFSRRCITNIITCIQYNRNTVRALWLLFEHFYTLNQLISSQQNCKNVSYIIFLGFFLLDTFVIFITCSSATTSQRRCVWINKVWPVILFKYYGW